jgi:hypothetical protein
MRPAPPAPLLLGIVLSLCTTSLATAEPEAPERIKARQLVAEGREALSKQQYSSALERFQQAYLLWPRPEIQFNLSLVYVELKDKINAAVHLRRFIARASASERAAIPEPIRNVLREVAVIRVQPQGPTITTWLNGRKVGTGDVEIVLLPGVYSLEMRDGDRVVQHEEFPLGGGQELVWRQSRAFQPRPVGRPRTSRDQAHHRSSRGTSRRLHYAAFVALAALAGCAGAAIVGTGIRARDLNDGYRTTGDPQTRDLGRSYQLTTNVLVGVAASAAVTAAVLAIFTRWPGKETSRSVRVTPALAPGGVAVQLGWRY